MTEGGTRRFTHGLAQQTQFCVRFIALRLQNGSFQTLQSCQLLIWFLFDPHLSPRILGNYWKSTSGRNGIFATSHSVTLHDKVCNCEDREGLNVVPLLRVRRSKLRWAGHVCRMYQEGLTRQVLVTTPTGNRSRSRPNTRWRDYISFSDLAWSVLVWIQQNCEIAENREVFRVLLGPLPLRPSPEAKKVWKWMNCGTLELATP